MYPTEILDRDSEVTGVEVTKVNEPLDPGMLVRDPAAREFSPFVPGSRYFGSK